MARVIDESHLGKILGCEVLGCEVELDFGKSPSPQVPTALETTLEPEADLQLWPHNWIFSLGCFKSPLFISSTWHQIWGTSSDRQCAGSNLNPLTLGILGLEICSNLCRRKPPGLEDFEIDQNISGPTSAIVLLFVVL